MLLKLQAVAVPLNTVSMHLRECKLLQAKVTSTACRWPPQASAGDAIMYLIRTWPLRPAVSLSVSNAGHHSNNAIAQVYTTAMRFHLAGSVTQH